MAEKPRYDGLTASALRAVLGVPFVALHEAVSSTQDVAHELAARGAGAETLVLANEQTAGRGRDGRRWWSPPEVGIWLTLLERPSDPGGLDALSARLGIRAAAVLDRYAPSPVRLKWPNDLYVDGRKLAGILVESRWRDARVEYVALGFGLNVRPHSSAPDAGYLNAGASRIEILTELVSALRDAAAARGTLTERELAAYAARDLARGRRCRAPAEGRVAGIDPAGAVLVCTARGPIACRSGSLILEEDS